MIQFEGLEENFQFLVVEVQSQLQRTFRYLAGPDHSQYRRIVDKDDYIDHLKTLIENKCFAKIHTDRSLQIKQVNLCQAMQKICVNLERIADFCVNVARQTNYLSDTSFITQAEYMDLFFEAQQSLARILPVMQTQDMAGAVEICRSEMRMDQLYKRGFDRIMENLREGREVENHITLLFILRYLERIGDSLLNIGEAIIFGILGEKIKIDQFESLNKSLSDTGFAQNMKDVDFQGIWGTRSGCHMGRVAPKDDPKGAEETGRLYKEGVKAKIAREKANLEHWEKLAPGLVPHVYNYSEEEDKACLLVEFLSGSSLDEIILGADTNLLETAAEKLRETIGRVWTSTKESGKVTLSYMAQVAERMDSILQMHPDFFRHTRTIGGKVVESTQDLIQHCEEIEKQIPAPFSVFIHGDFNVNNMVFNPNTQKIHYIDVYRSRRYDYIQDASVFLLSNFRMPVFEEALRSRLNGIIEDFYEFFKSFAEDQGDATFQARMALALARSFLTSTRFELHAKFAKEMFLRAHFLMEKLTVQKGHWEEFSLPMDILFY
ncbi:Phosphate uptake regulator [Desulfatibacillum alkenivorans DSM 16219]|jgi:phosphate uptake regulator/tRNA A-37 threonylcarbamoyl transferase component Bud32|uniref:Phosphate uptake regulator n=1 Tax=Desulfatibacillum alkenivorans DSM 16219 TaxID=1121393 RepID=A0A1M6YBH0_9BACT|nr:PhoU domain-containing protein [Desulfatibacillum alkenivorans]SHL15644.1 Phosphate uptake regulator [Desulfatibacillum alkenivorans DSM 16219]